MQPKNNVTYSLWNMLKLQRGILLWMGLAGCMASHPRIEGDGHHAVRPPWIPSPNRTHPDVLYVTGACRDQGNLDVGRQCAIQDAKRQLMENFRSETPPEIHGDYIEDEYHEKRNDSRAPLYDYWVLVAHPHMLRANRALLGVVCQSNTSDACDSHFVDLMEAAMTREKLTPAPPHLSPEIAAHTERSLQEAKQRKVTQLLIVNLQATFLGSDHGEFYAQATCGFSLLDAIDGKVIHASKIGPLKGGHLSQVMAEKKALEECIQQLSNKLRIPKRS